MGYRKITRSYEKGEYGTDFIKNFVIVKNHINGWVPQDVAFIKDFCYQTLGDNSARLTLTTICQRRTNHWPDFSKKFWEVVLEFDEIRNLKINQLEGFGNIQICGFAIEDIKDRQLENINIKVYDCEDEQVFFYAKSVTVKECKMIDHFHKQYPFQTVHF